MSPQSILQIVSLIVLPSALALWLCFPRPESHFELIVRLTVTGLTFLLLVLIGAWDWVGYGFRFYLPVIYAVCAFVSISRMRRVPFFEEARVWRRPINLACIVAMIPISAGVFLALAGRTYQGQAVELEFPLRDGLYNVGEGGSTRAINYHVPKGSQKYALDLDRLNGLGMRASLWNTDSLDGYDIFGEAVYSPCEGTVAVASDSSPDRLWGEATGEAETAGGNLVVIECRGVNVWLAHLMQGSVAVRRGTQVRAGDSIGRVGSSGLSEAPHLHIHVEGRAGVPVPMLFEGKFLVRNAIVKVGN